ncbi:hypothetical protein BpHYR1_046067 [Brachionus plicatilis]|uniref:Uncharacterized protein n=1 Tax=Brachionus plicatilis TaxID=10195 RepID=A0A3M7SRM9_BRAPC|nr:hypothetical protein BpHYR1_046067 [Brachionus plicatilis]
MIFQKKAKKTFPFLSKVTFKMLNFSFMLDLLRFKLVPSGKKGLYWKHLYFLMKDKNENHKQND